MRGRYVMQGHVGPSRIPECVSRVPARSTERDFNGGCDMMMIVLARGSVCRLRSAGTQGGHHGGPKPAAKNDLHACCRARARSMDGNMHDNMDDNRYGG